MKGHGRAPEPEPSRAAEDYLKAIYKLQQTSSSSVSTSDLAGELERSAASVTNMVKSLAEQGLVEHVPYYGVHLTDDGEAAALRIIRRHRVIESYLIERLGYTWDGVHAEAERLEHAASDELIDRMAGAMGDPAFDPHGSPIPDAEGKMEERPITRLTEVQEEVPAVVREVADEDPERLREAGALGLFPGTRVVVIHEQAPSTGLTVRVGGEARTVDEALAAAISVERL